MGGEKFDAPQPEAYLFGDNMDLNFLGNRPIPVRKCLKNGINTFDVEIISKFFISVSIPSTTVQRSN